ISGKESIPVIDKKAYLKLYKEIYDKAVSSTIMKKYHDLGTSGNVLPLNTLEALPTKNLQTSSFAEASSISGENIAKNYLGRRVACAHCPTGCIHLAALREPYLEEHYFYKTSMIAYDYELLYALGSMLGIKSAEECLTLIDTVEVFCIDAMTTGVVLAWATEMFEKKNISLKETDGIKPQWGNAAMYRKMVKRIITQPTEFYKAIAKGVDFASSKYGGKDFSMAFGKNEMAGYHTGPAAYLGFLIGARHSHLDNAGYSLDQSIMINEDPTPEKIVDKLIEEETLRQVLSSLTMCFFARGIYDIETISKALKVIGISHSAKELLQIGAKIYQQKFKFKFREGFSFDKLHVPERIFETKDPTGKLTKEFIRKGLEYANKKIL
ncbi:MAG: aldehyde:ferredoxin oxidoreductase, partial [Bacteroidetes bacterium]|nr:aldehyde:ferredoxin oxidoreductase [Bacteroidota bacterium]